MQVFVGAHSCTSPAWSRQYRSVVFAHDDEQAAIARKALEKVADNTKRPTTTAVETGFKFWLAEDYHQKYQLRRYREIDAELQAIYPDLEDYVDSTVTTRLNAWVSNYGSPAELGVDLEDLGLSTGLQSSLAKSLKVK